MPGRLRTRTHAYRRARERVLARNPVCHACFVADASETDHRVPFEDGGSDDEANLVPLCFPCHELRTREAAKEKRGEPG